LRAGLALFYTAFWDLTSTRRYRDGLIPWDTTRAWAREHGLDADATETLEHHIKAMDVAFLNWKSQNGGRGKTPPKGTPTDGNSPPVPGKHAAARRLGGG